jgi:hypothetical protein
MTAARSKAAVAAVTSHFLTDGYSDKPLSRRGEVEQRIRELRVQMWSSPEDRRELEGMIEAAEAELRQLERGGGA